MRATAVAVTVRIVNGLCVVVLDFHWVSDAVLGLILAELLIGLQQAISKWPVPDGRGRGRAGRRSGQHCRRDPRTMTPQRNA